MKQNGRWASYQTFVGQAISSRRSATSAQQFANDYNNNVHNNLGAVSLVPGPVGQAASGMNAAIYAGQGNVAGAAVSSIGIVPDLGAANRLRKAASVEKEGRMVAAKLAQEAEAVETSSAKSATRSISTAVPKGSGWATGPIHLGTPVASAIDKVPVQVRVSASQYPEAAAHIREAQQAGYPSVLSIDRQGAAARGTAARKGVPTIAGKDRDEYPFALTSEGGGSTSIKHIDSSQNRGAGSSISHQCRKVKNGGKIEVVVCD